MAEASQGRRLPGDVPRLDKPEETGIEFQTGRALQEFLGEIQDAVSGMQGTAETPSTVQAGVSADPVADDLSVASSSHVHALDTAAPSVKVALSGESDEGVGAAVMRADARLVLESAGAADGDVIVYDGDGWTTGSVVTAAENALSEAAVTVTEILSELQTISAILKQGLGVLDDVESLRQSFVEANPLTQELKTIALLLQIGLNVQASPR